MKRSLLVLLFVGRPLLRILRERSAGATENAELEKQLIGVTAPGAPGVAARSIGAVMFSLASVGPAVIPWMVGVISHSTGSLRAGLLLPLGATVILFVVHLVEW